MENFNPEFSPFLNSNFFFFFLISNNLFFKTGHYIQDCPTNGDPNFNFQRKPQTYHGIPKTFLETGETGTTPKPNE